MTNDTAVETLSTTRQQPYWERYELSDGVEEPRVRFDSDAPSLSLNGDWKFRYSPTPHIEPDLAEPALDDSGWNSIPVPAHWQLHGYGAPQYTNFRYPFPVDPPHLPDENPTGDYRHRFTLPAGWRAGRTVLRFDGIDSAARVWLNGTELGITSGSRLPTEFDITDAIVTGENLLSVRVHQWSSGSYLEDQDMFWLSGIFRDVTLLSRPNQGIDDFFVHADYDHTNGSGVLLVDAATPARLVVPELGIDAHTGSPIAITSVQPWSAEVPRLYDGQLISAGETVALRVGFRTVRIADGILTVNGDRVLFRGVNRHEFHPDSGRALDEATMLQDVLLMKRHNINAVRTSHYPPHPRFLELCDEYGLWVVDECDLETHGFMSDEGNLDTNPAKDPRWRDAVVSRMRRMVERDKNHPSIIVWSLGNECGPGDNLGAMADFARARDSSRVIHYEGDLTSQHVDLYSRMYASFDEVDAIGRYAEDALDDPELDAHRRAQPFILCEFAHAMGNGPGGLTEYQELFEKYPRCQGGFVWEWIDHGLRTTNADGVEIFGYGGDFGETLHDGNFVADGLVLPDRTPSPGLIEYKKVIEPVRISGDAAGITIANLHDTRDLAHLAFAWALEEGGRPIATGTLDVPPLAAGASVTVALPSLPPTTGETWLTVRAVLAADERWAPAGHEVAWGQLQLSTATPAGDAPTQAPEVTDEGIRLGDTLFDALTGRLLRIGTLEVEGPRLEVWRAPVDNDRAFSGFPLEKGWRDLGLDRVTHRTDAVQLDGDALVVRTRVAPASSPLGLFVTYRWTSTTAGLRLAVDVEPDGTWTSLLPRLGVVLSLPGSLGDATWFGRGPGEAYPDTQRAARVGLFESSVDGLQTNYVFPQENGSRTDTRWLDLRDARGTGLRVASSTPFAFTARRWTTADLDAARHAGELVPRDRVWLNLDHRQSGVGSAACGPATLPQYLLPVEPEHFELVFSAV